MRSVLGSILVVLSIAAPRALAGDVAYQLETAALDACDATQASQSTMIELVDRVWAVPGVEESQEPIEPVRTFDFLTARRFQIDCDGPEWLDSIAWPRTRELLHRNDNECFARVFALGSTDGIPLHR